ncbi:hypothetical protein [Streptomyces odonnellii]|uniref:hypothetical protein n=1 Tax=Streptomyces odonnellii TaxID=1417980 RepID=UPI000697BFD7|nr:hypothetical protein [Streptomyces odonnellii]
MNSRPNTVPYITEWSTERAPTPIVTARPHLGVAYTDEDSFDRDDEGALWARALLRPGKGKPEFGRVHPLRQQRAMRKMLCQICAGPADRNEQGWLWLLSGYRGDWHDWPEMVGSPHPPLCLPCAGKSVRLCPSLRGRFVAVRVREPKITGVLGPQLKDGVQLSAEQRGLRGDELAKYRLCLLCRGEGFCLPPGIGQLTTEVGQRRGQGGFESGRVVRGRPAFGTDEEGREVDGERGDDVGGAGKCGDRGAHGVVIGIAGVQGGL